MVSLCGQGSENYLVESVLSYYLHMSSVGHSDCQACVAQPAETTCCPDKNFTILLFVSFFFFSPFEPRALSMLVQKAAFGMFIVRSFIHMDEVLICGSYSKSII